MNNLITIQDLATSFSSQDHLEYKKMLDNSGISKDARKFLLRKVHEIRLDEDCAEFRKNQMHILENELAKHQFASNESSAFCEKLYNELDEASKILAQKRRNLRLAQQEVKQAEEEVSKLNGLYTHWQQISAQENSKVEDYSRVLETAKKALHESEHYILVHPTATLPAFSKKVGTGIFVCTKYDAEKLHFRKYADHVIEPEEDYTKDLLAGEDTKSLFESEDEFKSAMEFINLVLRFLFREKDYEILCNSDAVMNILDSII